MKKYMNRYRIILLALFTLLSVHSVWADDVSVEQALQIASQFAAANQPTLAKGEGGNASASAAQPRLAHAVRSKVAQKENVYIINLGNDQGFVVVSGESGTPNDILGYCDHGSFSYNDCPVQLKDLLASYSAAVDSLRQNPALAATAVKKAVQQYDSYLGNVIVEPLLTSTWNQTAPYNQQCPEVTAEGVDLGYRYGGHYATGCVPTAIAQIMLYWRWPEATSGTVSGEDFSGRTYDWDNMLDDYSRGYTADQAAAVAKLMADVGKAMHTQYGQPNGSLTYFLPYALTDNFGFQLDIEEKSAVTANTLKDDIIAELQENRPVPYFGHPASGDGHSLVCDGYTSNNYFHFNYGWGGNMDGWYKLTSVPMFNMNATIWKNFRPYDAIKKVVDGVEYGLLKNGTAEIISYAAGGVGTSNGVLEIPATIEDNGISYKVTRIRQQAFMRKGNFQKLVMGDNIQTIDAYAFFNNQIDTLVLSDKVETVPDEAFQIMTIKHLVIGANVKRIGKRAFYLSGLREGVISKSPAFEVDDEAFAQNYVSKEYEWLNCITSVGRKAFHGAKIDFWKKPEFRNLEVIGDSAFTFSYWGDGSPTVRLGPKVRKIAPSAFDGINSMSSIIIDEANSYFCHAGSPNNNVYNKKKTSLVIFKDEPNNPTKYPASLVKMEPGSIRPMCKYIYYGIPSTVVDMRGAFKDLQSLTYGSSLTCYAVTPPLLTDDSFSDAVLKDLGKKTLHVPQGTEELYRNASGWRLFGEIVGDQEYSPAPAQERQYFMVIEPVGESSRMTIPISEVSSMEISDDGKNVIIKRVDKDDITTTVAAIDSIKWSSGFVYEDAEVFNLNEENLTAEAQKCTVKFDATVIDGDVQLCVRNAVLTPYVTEGVTGGIAFDLSLSNGQHELDGTVEITVPFSVADGEQVGAAYYNEETGEWEPVCYEYDKNAGTVKITTSHLSLYSVIKNNPVYRCSIVGAMDPIVQFERIESAIEFDRKVKDALVKLIQIVQSEYPETEQALLFKDEMGLWQSVGLDGLWNIVRGSGEALIDFRPEKIDKVVDGFGYLGTAISIFDVARAEANGDQIGVASGSLKTILNYSTMLAGKVIGSTLFSVSMGMVSFIGVALEKFGTTVQQRKYDIYKAIYNYFYSRKGRDDQDVRSCYRSAQDWYKLFYPVVLEGNMTESEWMTYVKEKVEEYCNQLWSGKYNDAYTSCYLICKSQFPFTTFAWPEESMKRQLSEEHFAELMNGELVSVFTAIKNRQKVEAHNLSTKALKVVAAMMNTQLGLRIVDSEWKEGETSKYAGWKIGFSEFPNGLEGAEKLKKPLNEKGRAGLGWVTIYALVDNAIPTQLTLYDPDDKPQKTYNFQIPDGEGKLFIDIDLATGGEKADNQKLEGLELTYDPNVVEYPFVFDNDVEHHDWEGSQREGYGLLYLDNALNKRARFQAGIEKFLNRHDYISVDKYGNYKIGDDIVGSFAGNGLVATGKFTMKTSHKFTERTVSQYLQLLENPTNRDWAYGLLDGIIQHQIKCEYTITRASVDSNEFEVTYTGTGEYALLANVAGRVEGADSDALAHGEAFNPLFVHITPEQVSFDGNVTLEYTTTIKAPVEQQP